MGKRGASQIDWIMSLSLFLLYVGWFFVFVTPSINFATSKDTLILNLKDNFEDEFKASLIKYPIFIDYSGEAGMKPVFVNYTSNHTDLNFLEGTDYLIWAGNLIFLANLSSDMTTYWVIQGKNYTNSPDFVGMNTEDTRVSTENISVYFENSFPDRIVYKDDTKINGVDYYANEYSLSSTNYTYNDSGFAAIYSATTKNINHTSFVFAFNRDIYNFITIDNPQSNYTFEINLNLDDYPSYYSDNLHFGDFPYGNGSESLNYSYDEITFYGDGALTIFFDNYVEFNLTSYNTTLNAQIKIPVSGSIYLYKYIFHEGNYSAVNRTAYESRIGSIHELEGIYIENITTNYTQLKSRWGFPSTRNFDIRVYGNSSAYNYGNSSAYNFEQSPSYRIGTFNPRARTVYSETEDTYALDDEGNYLPISINYRIW